MKKLPSLKTCIIMDVIGSLSYFVPVLGETFDMAWAPISAVIFFSMFGQKLGVKGALFSFVEEWLPFTDIIPTFTISWFIRRAEMAKTNISR